MTMSMGAVKDMRRLAIGIMISLMAVTIAGCQTAPHSEVERRVETWRVLERIGDVRMARNGGSATQSLRPGDRIAGAGEVVTGRSAVLILATGGVQLTVGERTSFRLPDTAPTASLFLDQGSLRARVATSVDRAIRIMTDHFDINTSDAVLTLRAGPGGDDHLSIESGRAGLTTVDGRHSTTLVAGAAAKIDRVSGNALLVRPASGRPFSKVTPFLAEGQQGTDDHIARPPDSGMGQPPAPSIDTMTSNPAAGAVIRPASMLKEVDKDILHVPGSLIDSPSLPLESRASMPAARTEDSEIWRARSEGLQDREVSTPINASSTAHSLDGEEDQDLMMDKFNFDPWQDGFERLTEGLLDGL